MKSLTKKIAFISEHASPLASLGGVDSGGQNVYVDRLARKLVDVGYEVDVFTRKDRPELPQVVELCPGVRVVHIEAGPERPIPKEELLDWMGDFTARMEQFISSRSREYELIHAHFFMSALVAADIKKDLGIPFVVTFHALGKVRRIHQKEADRFPDARFDIEERIMQEADKIIAECPQDFQDFVNYYEAPEGNIVTIPCGVDLKDFYPIDSMVARMVLGLDHKEHIILQLGRMVKRKGVANVVEALALLNEAGMASVRLVVVGGESDKPDPEVTPEIGRLQDLGERLGIGEQITFVGRKNRDQLKFYYNAADVFVSTPWYEPFGMTPLESMACGTPVIGSRVGGIKYSVDEEETGFLVPPKDPGSLADKLQLLLTDQSLKAQMGQQALERVEKQFTWDKVTRNIIDVYEHVTTSTYVSNGCQQDLGVIGKGFAELIQVAKRTEKVLNTSVLEASKVLGRCLLQEGKVMICGNGGSASDAQHFAAELVGRFDIENRPALPGVSLNTDTSVMTSLANDYGYERVFARQVEGLGNPQDVLVGISTSGNSANVLEAFRTAKKKNIKCISLSGRGGGQLESLSDLALTVPSENTQIIQEVHIHLIHTLCGLIEGHLFTGEASLMEVSNINMNGT